MEKGDLAAVIIGLSLVIVLMVVTSPPPASATVPGPVPTTPVPTPDYPIYGVPVSTPEPVPGTPPPTPFPAERILYTQDYSRFPVRFLPADMGLFGVSDIEWPYGSSFTFAYLEENHGGITRPFIVTYPVWRMVTKVTADRTPEKARFRMVLVDRQTGRILEGVEIRFPGSMTKTIGSHGRPLYLVVSAEYVDLFRVSFEAPSEFMK